MIKKDITIVFFIGIIALFVVPFSTFAAYDSNTGGGGLLPECINSPGGCTLCDAWPLADNIINFLLFWLAIPVLTIVLIWGGVVWVTAGGSPKNIEHGKAIMTSGIIGILIAFAGWLIVDTIIKSLASGGNVIGAWQEFPDKTYCENPELANEEISLEDITPAGYQPSNWLLKYCSVTRCTPANYDQGFWNPGGKFATKEDCIAKGERTGGSSPDNFICVEEKIECKNVDICSPKATPCSSSSCPQYTPYAVKYANSIATAPILKSIIFNESSCNVGAISSVGACGPTQLLPSTANMFKNRCGITDQIDCSWLIDQANIEKTVCITAAYIEGLGGGTCGNDVRNIAAGYNGGEGACQQSNSCTDETSCNGTTMRKWECLYDDTAHTQCNTGYIETRNYAPKVLYCANSPGF